MGDGFFNTFPELGMFDADGDGHFGPIEAGFLLNFGAALADAEKEEEREGRRGHSRSGVEQHRDARTRDSAVMDPFSPLHDDEDGEDDEDRAWAYDIDEDDYDDDAVNPYMIRTSDGIRINPASRDDVMLFADELPQDELEALLWESVSLGVCYSTDDVEFLEGYVEDEDLVSMLRANSFSE